MHQHGVLSGYEIEKQLKEGRIQIDPFNPDHVNPASVDLTLGDQVLVYRDAIDYEEYDVTDGSEIIPSLDKNVLDSRQPNRTVSYKIGPRGWVLKPGVGYLMHTAERVFTESFVPVLDGKSSVGRLFIKVHETAGYGDPGFNGQYTLEVTSVYPVRVYTGMRICQVRFHSIAGQPKLYQGHYRNDTAKGAVASRSWQQFEEMDEAAVERRMLECKEDHEAVRRSGSDDGCLKCGYYAK